MSSYSPPGPAPREQHERPWLFLSVPRDADPHVLKAAVAQLPGCESVAMGEVASKGQLSASFEHPSSRRSAADAIAADCKLAGMSVRLISGDASSPENSPPLRPSSTHSRHNSTLHLPDTLYEGGGAAPLELNSHTSFTSQLSSASGARHGAGGALGSCGGPPSGGDPVSYGSSTLGAAAAARWSPGGAATAAGLGGFAPAEYRSASAPLTAAAEQRSAVQAVLAARLNTITVSCNEGRRAGSSGGEAPPPQQPFSAHALLQRNRSPSSQRGRGCGGGAVRGQPQGHAHTPPWPRSAGAYPPLPPSSQAPSSGGVAQFSSGPFTDYPHSHNSFDRGSPGPPAGAPRGPPDDAPGRCGPELSRQRLYVVVSKSATEEQIAKLFKRFGGMEYCNLKRDKKTGQSKGYCFVNFSTEDSAELAKKALHGIEFPPGSGKPMKVLYSEVLTTRTGGGGGRGAPLPPPPPPPPLPLGFFPPAELPRAHADAHRPASNGGTRGTYTAPPHCDIGASPRGSAYRAPPPPLPGRPSPEALGGGLLLPLRHQELSLLFADPAALLVQLARPLPTYALQHELARFGAVVFVHLHEDDSRFAVVKFEDVGAAEAARGALDGGQVVGIPLHVDFANDPASPLRAQFLPRGGCYVPPAQAASGGLYPVSMGPSSHGLSSSSSAHACLQPPLPRPPSPHHLHHFATEPAYGARHTYMHPGQGAPGLFVDAPPPPPPASGAAFWPQTALGQAGLGAVQDGRYLAASGT